MDQAGELVERLRRNPGDAQAYTALKDVYRAGGDAAAYAQLVDHWARQLADKTAASTEYCDAANTSVQLGDLSRAEALFKHALAVDPFNVDASEGMQSLLDSRGAYQELAEFLQRHIATLQSSAGEPAYIAVLCFRLGEVWNTKLGRQDQALQDYARAFEHDPKLLIAIYQAREIHLAAGRLEPAAELYLREAVAEADAERRLKLLEEMVRLREELGQPARAIEGLEHALAAVPGDLQIMHLTVTRLLAPADAGSVGDIEGARTRASELLTSMASGVPSDTALSYLSTALDQQPGNLDALAAFEDTARTAGRSAEIPARWVACLAALGDAPQAKPIRLALARAYWEAGQRDDALFCLQPLADDPDALALRREWGAADRGLPRAPAPSEPEAAEHEPQRPSEAFNEELDDAFRALTAEPEQSLPDETAAAAPSPTTSDAPATASERPAGAREPVSARSPAPASSPAAAMPSAKPDAAPGRGRPEPEASPPSRIDELRRLVSQHVANDNQDEAAVYAREILSLDASDPGAFTFLEAYYRQRQRFGQLRDLLLESTRVPGLSVDARKLRLREIAALSENKLRDPEGAIDAWGSIVALDPTDARATEALKRLLERTQRWDELAELLEREVFGTSEDHDRAALLERLAALHKGKRGDLAQAAEAYRQLLDLRPDDRVARAELCTILLELERYDEGLPLLRSQIEDEQDRAKRASLLRTLAAVLDTKLDDREGAFEACREILSITEHDADALGRMEAIDEELGNFERLLETLELRLKVTPTSERATLLSRMGLLAARQLFDAERGAQYLKRAHELQPHDEQLASGLAQLLEEAGQTEELVDLLEQRAGGTADVAERAELYRRIAHLSIEQLQDQQRAAAAYDNLLEHEEDPAALQYLREVAKSRGDSERFVELSKRLAATIEDASEKRDVLFERAVSLLAQEPGQAAEAFREVLALDPGYEPALDALADACAQAGDTAGVADALQRRLERAEDPEDVLRITRQLSELYETELEDEDQAIATLLTWASHDLADPEPRQRLLPLLDKAQRWQQLVAVLDQLAELEAELDERQAQALRAATVLAEQLGDTEGAWQRLEPLVRQDHAEATDAMWALAERTGLQERLAGIFITLAQQAQEPSEQKRHWQQTAKVYEQQLGDATNALEASLRMFAADLGDRDALAEVDRLAVKAGSWPRLQQVYDRLIRSAQDTPERVELLMRHAALLDEQAGQPSVALDRVLAACGLDPDDEELLERAEQLAGRAARDAELIGLYERRAAAADDDAERVELQIRAARLCESALEDRERAIGYLKQALVATHGAEDLVGHVVTVARQFDAQQTDAGDQDARRRLVHAFVEAAEGELEEGPLLLQHAVTLIKDELGDTSAAFDLLKRATTLFPSHAPLLDALQEVAVEGGQLDALDKHLASLTDEAIDAKTTTTLLERRAALLEGPLSRHGDAADVYERLLRFSSDDEQIWHKLRDNLRRSGRHQDLLMAIDRSLKHVSDEADKLDLQREVATIWEQQLKNRWEALDAWSKVLELAPEDAEASQAIQRLRARTSIPAMSDEELFAEPPPPAESPQDRAASHPEPLPPASAANEAAGEEQTSSPRQEGLSAITAPAASLDDDRTSAEAGETDEPAEPHLDAPEPDETFEAAAHEGESAHAAQDLAAQLSDWEEEGGGASEAAPEAPQEDDFAQVGDDAFEEIDESEAEARRESIAPAVPDDASAREPSSVPPPLPPRGGPASKDD